tara:strand:- start:1797 stop:3545 length:1749 start_codon:yes stop_codon:yes gene_type:complete
MAFTAADWSITRNGGALDVRYIGDAHNGTTPSYATTIELHRALQDFADDEQDSSDDELSIIDQTPSDRGGADTNITLLNGCNLTDADTEHIYDGSITQAAGATIYDGIQVFGNSSNIQVVQDGNRIINDFWNEPKMKTAVSDALSSTTHRFLIKVRDAGSDIDGRRLLGTQRELGTVYTEFFIGGGTNRGNNVLALTGNSDGNNQTSAGVIETWDDITNVTEGFNGISIGGTSYDFYSAWDLGARTKNNFYERSKWIQTRVAGIGVDTPARDADQALYGLPGDIFRGITHELDVDTPTGTFSMVAAEEVTWTGGVGQLLAINSATAATKMWIQLLKGVVPTDGQVITGGTSTASVALNTTVTPRLIAPTFAGTSTGSAINPGAFGLGIDSADLTQNDLVVDLTNTQRTPPNNVVYTVNNTVIGDYVVSANNAAGNFEFTQLSITNAEVGASVTSIVFDETISSDIPRPSGTIRVEQVNGSYRRIAYTSITTTTNPDDTINFSTLDFSGVGAGLAIGGNAFITYIDRVATATSETSTFVYNAPRTLFTRVRNANPGVEIKTFETTASVGSGGGSSTVGRIDDF